MKNESGSKDLPDKEKIDEWGQAARFVASWSDSQTSFFTNFAIIGLTFVLVGLELVRFNILASAIVVILGLGVQGYGIKKAYDFRKFHNNIMDLWSTHTTLRLGAAEGMDEYVQRLKEVSKTI